MSISTSRPFQRPELCRPVPRKLLTGLLGGRGRNSFPQSANQLRYLVPRTALCGSDSMAHHYYATAQIAGHKRFDLTLPAGRTDSSMKYSGSSSRKKRKALFALTNSTCMMGHWAPLSIRLPLAFSCRYSHGNFVLETPPNEGDGENHDLRSR